MSKKPLAIILAFFIVFAPVYANAVLLPLLAVAASSTGRVLVGNAIKRVGQAAISRAGMASMAAGLGYMGSTKSAIEQDGWMIDYGSGGGGAGGSWDAPNGGGVDSQGNIDISIYKYPPNDSCEIVFGWSNSSMTYDDPNFVAPVAFSVLYNRNLSTSQRMYPNDEIISLDSHVLSDASAKEQQYKSLYPDSKNVNWLYSGFSNTYRFSRSGWGNSGINEHSGYMFYKCAPYPLNKTYITNNEFNAYLTKNITVNDAGDLIKNIYNYDYSQHPNITINNNTTGGNSLNNDLSLNVDPNADIKVSPRLRLDIESNKVNLDNVNDENCTKNEAGEYDNCTGEPDPEEEETDPDDPNNPSPEEPSPIECDANGFYRKVCDWMDWTKENPTPSEEPPADIKNIQAESTNKIDMAGECPAPYELNFTIAGYAQNNSISYEPLCGALEMLKPIFIGSGALSGMFILMGYSRPSGTGAN